MLPQIKMLDLNAQYGLLEVYIDEAIANVITNSTFIGGEAVRNFEREFAEYVGAKYCIAVANGTDALEIILEALEIVERPVIVPAMTAAPTVEAIMRTGNHPVFCDIDCHYTLDPAKAKRLLSRGSVVLPVHLYGAPGDMSYLLDLVQGHTVIEDCAQAHGTRHQGKHVGTFGKAGAFSFYPGKNLGAFGDAGAIVTDDEEVAERCRRISNHGRLGKFDHALVGRNSRMDALQASVLSVKLRRLEDWNEVRRAIAKRYFGEFPREVLPCWERAGDVYSYHQFPLRVKNRAAVQRELSARGVATGIHYPFAVSELSPYSWHGRHYPNAEALAREELSIPVHEMLWADDVTRVIAAVLEVLSEQN